MSNQEPPFAEEPPLQEYPGQQLFPGQQPQAPYTPQPSYPGQPLRPRRRRGLLWGCLIALAVLLVCLGIAIAGTVLGFIGVFKHSVTDPVKTYQVAPNPRLILNDNAGSVTVNSGSQNSIAIQTTRYSSFIGNINDVQVQESLDSANNTLTVTVNQPGGQNFFNVTGVDFAITMPNSANLQITTNAGSIHVSGVSGSMSLITNAGSISVAGAALGGSSTFKTDAGTIDFKGSIGSSGTYDFETNAGSINVTLPATSAFHVNASTDAGSIDTSFPVTVNHRTPGASINGDIGATPQATLTLKTNAGSITLNKGA